MPFLYFCAMYRIREFIRNNPVRVAAFVSSTVALLATVFFPELQTETVVVFALSALGLGEYAQRVENAKTDEALNTPAPKKTRSKA